MALKNLGRLHESVRSDVEKYCGRLVTALGSNLRSIAACGSATGPDFIPGKSNVNLVLVPGKLDESVVSGLIIGICFS